MSSDFLLSAELRRSRDLLARCSQAMAITSEAVERSHELCLAVRRGDHRTPLERPEPFP